MYRLYAKSLGVALSIGMLVFFLLAQVASIYSNVWLSEWTSDPLLMNTTISNTSQFANRQNLYLAVYGALNGAQGTTFIQVYPPGSTAENNEDFAELTTSVSAEHY